MPDKADAPLIPLWLKLVAVTLAIVLTGAYIWRQQEIQNRDNASAQNINLVENPKQYILAGRAEEPPLEYYHENPAEEEASAINNGATVSPELVKEIHRYQTEKNQTGISNSELATTDLASETEFHQKLDEMKPKNATEVGTEATTLENDSALQHPPTTAE